MYKVNCVVCSKEFETFHPKYLCCSAECGKTNKINKKYLRLSSDWSLYFRHLLSKKKTDITAKDLVELLKRQKGKCALSGAILTCEKVKGKYVKTNASIDRIIAGGEYNIENVQLVCRALNSFRHNLTVKEFIQWCKKVAKNGIYKKP
tara:strand:- start:3241 stop:3684 length:444 start_codon:yes stop_codon:yes gene_type:complete